MNEIRVVLKRGVIALIKNNASGFRVKIISHLTGEILCNFPRVHPDELIQILLDCEDY